MKNPFKIGDRKEYQIVVGAEDVASFEAGLVHPFYATFALGRDAEWSSRLFVLEMKDEDEEGIGTYLHINHQSPAMLGDSVTFVSIINNIAGNSVECDFEAYVGDRLIASGKTGQKILKKERLQKMMDQINGR